MTRSRRNRLAVAIIGVIGFIVLLPRMAAAQPAHVLWAEELVYNVSPNRNEYETNPSYIKWAGVDGAHYYANHTLCNGFVTSLLKQAYGWSDTDIKDWLGAKSPPAAVYHDEIQAGNGFDVVPTVADIQAGDIIAIDYPDGDLVSGHVAVAQGPAVLRLSTTPVVEGTYQFEVVVIDSSKTGHGALDTRRLVDGTFHPGAGIGTMRLYTDGDLNIVGHTWSTFSNSPYRTQSTHHMVIGRLQ